MEEIIFKSTSELYKRLKPALYSKIVELNRKGLNFIKEEDIWNYLVLNVWKEKKGLSLTDLTSDILYVNETDLKKYVLEDIKRIERDVKNIDESLL